jgi:hypothetical protein
MPDLVTRSLIRGDRPMSRVECRNPCADLPASCSGFESRLVLVDCRVGCGGGEGVRWRFDRDRGRVSAADFVAIDFGVDAEGFLACIPLGGGL